MRKPTTRRARGSGGGRPLRILIAIGPVGLLRIVECLLAGLPHLVIVGRVDRPDDLPRRAARSVPHVVVAGVRLLGREHRHILADVHRSSPDSKLVLIHPVPEAGRPPAPVHALLPEEAVVKRLPRLMRRLARGSDERRP